MMLAAFAVAAVRPAASVALAVAADMLSVVPLPVGLAVYPVVSLAAASASNRNHDK